MVPPPPGACPECNTEHDPDDAHNVVSMHYHLGFKGRHGRWPTWEDAMAHCSPERQNAIRTALKALGLPNDPREARRERCKLTARAKALRL